MAVNNQSMKDEHLTFKHTMSKTLWQEFLSDGQKKHGVNKKDREAIYRHITDEWNMLHPITLVSES